jgi:NAD(P)-dependent dehydrogenase (short-subunit alcohol dehydrogenase family)
MTIKKWLAQNTHSLKGKTVAITGSTGGIGKELCKYLAYLGASLILIDRNSQRSADNKNELCSLFEGISVRIIGCDLSDISSVKNAVAELRNLKIDYFIHNAGAYSIPRYKTREGYDNVFTINFISIGF